MQDCVGTFKHGRFLAITVFHSQAAIFLGMYPATRILARKSLPCLIVLLALHQWCVFCVVRTLELNFLMPPGSFSECQLPWKVLAVKTDFHMSTWTGRGAPVNSVCWLQNVETVAMKTSSWSHSWRVAWLALQLEWRSKHYASQMYWSTSYSGVCLCLNSFVYCMANYP